MKVTGYPYALESIQAELNDATRMYRKIAEDRKRKLDQPNEKLHYWDGKITGLKLALAYLGKVRKE